MDESLPPPPIGNVSTTAPGGPQYEYPGGYTPPPGFYGAPPAPTAPPGAIRADAIPNAYMPPPQVPAGYYPYDPGNFSPNVGDWFSQNYNPDQYRTVAGEIPGAQPTPYDNYAGPSDVLEGQRPTGAGGIATEGLGPTEFGEPTPTGTPPGLGPPEGSELANATNFYPDGQGGYWAYDSNWNYVGTVGGPTGVTPDVAPATAAPGQEPTDIQGAPQYANIPGGYDPRDPGQLGYGTVRPPNKFLSDLGLDVRDALNTLQNVFGNVGPATTYAPWGAHPSAFGGGAFWSPPGGSIGGPLGTGSAGTLGAGYNRLNQLSAAALMRGRDPSLGFEGFTNWQMRPGLANVLPRAQWGGYQGENYDYQPGRTLGNPPSGRGGGGQSVV